MTYNNRWLVAVLFIFTLILVACSDGVVSPEKIEPAEIISTAGEQNRLILTEKAVERLDIRTEEVREEEVDGRVRLVISYSAILYDLNGGAWIYINPEARTYIRELVSIEFIDEGTVVLTEGPAPGTKIVTVGAAELYGTDTGVGK